MTTQRRPAADPPFWRTAAKFLAALVGAIVLAGGVILAALDDDHLTTSEIVAIVLAVLGGLGLPTAVYTLPNALTRKQVREAVASVPTTLADDVVVEAIPSSTRRVKGRVVTDGSAAAARRYPPPTQRTTTGDPWTPPDEP